MSSTVNIIGSGIGGLATAIRLANKGFKVTVFEKNAYPGGKLSELKIGNYRFDKGPSLLTMPELVDELTQLCNYKTPFNYTQLNTITHYFYEDGTTLIADKSVDKFARELSEKLNEDEKKVHRHLKQSEFYYSSVADLFLKQSLHKTKNFLNVKTLKGIWRLPRLNVFNTMHKVNAKAFLNPKTVQLFNRYATYNGSSPYKAPALLNIIPHLEFGMGAFIPEKGMHQITEHLYSLAGYCGVTFKFNELVEKIVIEKNRTSGIISNSIYYESDFVVSDADMHVVYKKLLPTSFTPKKMLMQEKSSSAYVFYWGIKKEFKQLGLHNILFSENYKEEFRCLFEEDKPFTDPTVYINITSKYCKADAPNGCENWFVMINVPHNKKSTKISYDFELRKNVIRKINRMLNINIESLIEVESVLDPKEIENQTSSIGGSLYGNASNNKFSAFLRHPNYSSKIKGLFFVGGSVHPGGGIPLCLFSAKIVADMLKNNG